MIPAFNPLSWGTYGYVAGTSGSPTIPAGAKVQNIIVTAGGLGSGTFTINGGDTITVPTNRSISIPVNGALKGPSLSFSSTGSYFVDWRI